MRFNFRKIKIGVKAHFSKSLLIKTENVCVILGKKINGSLVLEVSNNISPLETLNIFLELRYKNIRGDEKQNTTFTVSPPFVAGVPVFCLKHNASTNQIRIGGRAKFFFEILMRRLISTVRVEVSNNNNEYFTSIYYVPFVCNQEKIKREKSVGAWARIYEFHKSYF